MAACPTRRHTGRYSSHSMPMTAAKKKRVYNPEEDDRLQYRVRAEAGRERRGEQVRSERWAGARVARSLGARPPLQDSRAAMMRQPVPASHPPLPGPPPGARSQHSVTTSSRHTPVPAPRHLEANPTRQPVPRPHQPPAMQRSKINTSWLSNPGVYLDPDSKASYYWLALVTAAVVYNWTVIILRVAFEEMRQTGLPHKVFRILDLISDVIYLSDIAIQSRTTFLEEGCVVKSLSETVGRYRSQPRFVLDVLAVIPVSVLHFSLAKFFPKLRLSLGTNAIGTPSLRILTLLKFPTIVLFFQNTKSRTSHPNVLRMCKLLLFICFLNHWVASLYYMLSKYEGLGSNNWVYQAPSYHSSFSRKYIHCFYWSTVTLATIGERPGPVTNLEHAFTGITFLIGVFLFAFIVGSVGDIINNINAESRHFQTRMDTLQFYLTQQQVPEHMQKQVQKWADYSWQKTKCLDDQWLLQLLPDPLRTEVATHLHLPRLKKIRLLKHCEEGFLRELALKLRSCIYTPGQYICRIGDVGREMYIIEHGKVEVMFADPKSGQLMQAATLTHGNHFGELSLFKMDGGQNKRAADVQSVGFSELLSLSRNDLMSVLTDYPETKYALETRARHRLSQSRKSPTSSQEICVDKFSKRSISLSEKVKKSASTSTHASIQSIVTEVLKREALSTNHLKSQQDFSQIKDVLTDLKKNRSEAHMMEKLLKDKEAEMQQVRHQLVTLQRQVALTQALGPAALQLFSTLPMTPTQMARGDSASIDSQQQVAVNPDLVVAKSEQDPTYSEVAPSINPVPITAPGNRRRRGSPPSKFMHSAETGAYHTEAHLSRPEQQQPDSSAVQASGGKGGDGKAMWPSSKHTEPAVKAAKSEITAPAPLYSNTTLYHSSLESSTSLTTVTSALKTHNSNFINLRFYSASTPVLQNIKEVQQLRVSETDSKDCWDLLCLKQHNTTSSSMDTVSTEISTTSSSSGGRGRGPKPAKPRPRYRTFSCLADPAPQPVLEAAQFADAPFPEPKIEEETFLTAAESILSEPVPISLPPTPVLFKSGSISSMGAGACVEDGQMRTWNKSSSCWPEESRRKPAEHKLSDGAGHVAATGVKSEGQSKPLGGRLQESESDGEFVSLISATRAKSLPGVVEDCTRQVCRKIDDKELSILLAKRREINDAPEHTVECQDRDMICSEVESELHRAEHGHSVNTVFDADYESRENIPSKTENLSPPECTIQELEAHELSNLEDGTPDHKLNNPDHKLNNPDHKLNNPDHKLNKQLLEGSLANEAQAVKHESIEQKTAVNNRNDMVSETKESSSPNDREMVPVPKEGELKLDTSPLRSASEAIPKDTFVTIPNADSIIEEVRQFLETEPCPHQIMENSREGRCKATKERCNATKCIAETSQDAELSTDGSPTRQERTQWKHKLNFIEMNQGPLQNDIVNLNDDKEKWNNLAKRPCESDNHMSDAFREVSHSQPKTLKREESKQRESHYQKDTQPISVCQMNSHSPLGTGTVTSHSPLGTGTERVASSKQQGRCESPGLLESSSVSRCNESKLLSPESSQQQPHGKCKTKSRFSKVEFVFSSSQNITGGTKSCKDTFDNTGSSCKIECDVLVDGYSTQYEDSQSNDSLVNTPDHNRQFRLDKRNEQTELCDTSANLLLSGSKPSSGMKEKTSVLEPSSHGCQFEEESYDGDIPKSFVLLDSSLYTKNTSFSKVVIDAEGNRFVQVSPERASVQNENAGREPYVTKRCKEGEDALQDHMNDRTASRKLRDTDQAVARQEPKQNASVESPKAESSCKSSRLNIDKHYDVPLEEENPEGKDQEKQTAIKRRYSASVYRKHNLLLETTDNENYPTRLPRPSHPRGGRYSSPSPKKIGDSPNGSNNQARASSVPSYIGSKIPATCKNSSLAEADKCPVQRERTQNTANAAGVLFSPPHQKNQPRHGFTKLSPSRKKNESPEYGTVEKTNAKDVNKQPVADNVNSGKNKMAGERRIHHRHKENEAKPAQDTGQGLERLERPSTQRRGEKRSGSESCPVSPNKSSLHASMLSSLQQTRTEKAEKSFKAKIEEAAKRMRRSDILDKANNSISSVHSLSASSDSSHSSPETIITTSDCTNYVPSRPASLDKGIHPTKKEGHVNLVSDQDLSMDARSAWIIENSYSRLIEDFSDSGPRRASLIPQRHLERNKKYDSCRLPRQVTLSIPLGKQSRREKGRRGAGVDRRRSEAGGRGLVDGSLEERLMEVMVGGAVMEALQHTDILLSSPSSSSSPEKSSTEDEDWDVRRVPSIIHLADFEVEDQDDLAILDLSECAEASDANSDLDELG